jgi:hypothetical protein
MLLGLATGDSLGNTTEGQLPDSRHPICEYAPNRYAGGRAVGLPSDDTQLAFWTLEHLLEHDRIVPERLLATFAERRIFGVGLLGMAVTPQPSWWLDTFLSRARPLEGEVQLRPRHPGLAFRGPLWRLVDTEVRRALDEQLTVREACDRWYSGAFLLETLP